MFEKARPGTGLAIRVEWSQLLRCDPQTVGQSVGARAGIYRLLHRGPDGKFRTFYVGVADNLLERVGVHFSPSELNRCIKSIISHGDCRFKFAYVESETERRGAERYLWANLSGLCNDQEPNAEPIEVNLS